MEIDFFSNGTPAAGDVRAVVADAAGASTARVLDAQGRMLKQIAADGGILQWKRDGNNFVTQLIDALNRVTTLQRDGSGYLTQMILPDGASRSYQYQTIRPRAS